MTPRQLAAHLHFQGAIQREADSRALVINAIAARGKEDAVDNMLAELAKHPA